MRRHERRMGPRTAFLAALGVAGALLVALARVGQLLRAIACGGVAVGGVLVVLAASFWGTLIMGVLSAVVRRREGGSVWELDEALSQPAEHDLDPGLELLAAGVLVYRVSEVKLHAHFRHVPLANARALRPFVVARIGMARPHEFSFALTDEEDATRYEQTFSHDLQPDPQLVMPPVRLTLEAPSRLRGRRWRLQVRAGATVITTFRVEFVEGGDHALARPESGADEPPLAWQQRLLPRLLDDALKRDAMLQPHDVVWEEG